MSRSTTSAGSSPPIGDDLTRAGQQSMTQAAWLQPVQARFTAQLEQNRLPHGLLIDGAPGWGQSQAAAWLAAQLLGLPLAAGTNADLPRVPITPIDLQQLAHPDFRWIEPDGAIIKVDQIRQLNEFAQSTASAGPEARKVAIVDQAHALNPSAANALLKTLEEPAANTYVVLTTGYPSRLLPTLRSRCQHYTVHADRAALAAWLSTDAPSGLAALSPKQQQALLFECGYAPELLLQRGDTLLYSMFNSALSFTSGTGGVERNKLLDALLEQDAATVILSWLRYLVGELAGAQRFTPLADKPARDLLGFMDELLRVQRQLLASNSAMPKLQLERLLLRWQRLAQS